MQFQLIRQFNEGALRLAESLSPVSDMKLILSLLALFFLVSCINAEATLPPVVVTDTAMISTGTSQPPTPAPTRTPTFEPPCNPFDQEFCITDGQFILQRPLQPPANDRVDPTYRYGSTAGGTRDPHHGVEFVNASGTPVHAAADGVVIFAGHDEEAVYAPWPNFYGNLVVIEHADELFTLYAHLSRVDVQSGQEISAGDTIGAVGRTGVAIGSHLHFEVRQGSGEDYFATQNPELWLAPAMDVNGELLGTLQMTVVDEGHTLVKHAEFTLQYYPDPSPPPAKSYYGTTYAAEMLTGEESAVLGELPSGRYRITVQGNGQLHERWVEVESGRLTHVAIVVK